MKAKLDDAMKQDASAGSAAGLQQLEAAVSSYNEGLYLDKTTSVADKLEKWSGEVCSWLASEPSGVVNTEKCLQVTAHASFGKLKAAVLNNACTCGGAGSPGAPSCLLHCESPQLMDLLYEVLRVVHGTFGDNFICFANLFLDETLRGHWARDMCLMCLSLRFWLFEISRLLFKQTSTH